MSAFLIDDIAGCFVTLQQRFIGVRQVSTEFNARDAERPDVHSAIILAVVHRKDHLRCHPVRRPDE